MLTGNLKAVTAIVWRPERRCRAKRNRRRAQESCSRWLQKNRAGNTAEIDQAAAPERPTARRSLRQWGRDAALVVPKTLRPRAHNAAAVVNELKVDDMWQGYQTRQFSHETEDFGAGKHVNISSNLGAYPPAGPDRRSRADGHRAPDVPRIRVETRGSRAHSSLAARGSSCVRPPGFPMFPMDSIVPLARRRSQGGSRDRTWGG